MSSTDRQLWLLGEAIVDVTLGQGSQPAKLRFGGVMHAARGLWAAGVPYAIAYVAPGYLVRQFEAFAAAHDAVRCVRVGDIEGSPNVLVVREPTEAGPQGYELLLRDEKRVSLDRTELQETLTEAEDVHRQAHTRLRGERWRRRVRRRTATQVTAGGGHLRLRCCRGG